MEEDPGNPVSLHKSRVQLGGNIAVKYPYQIVESVQLTIGLFQQANGFIFIYNIQIVEPIPTRGFGKNIDLPVVTMKIFYQIKKDTLVLTVVFKPVNGK